MILAPTRRLAAVTIAAGLLLAACSGGSSAAPIQPSGSPAASQPASGAPSGQPAGGLPAGCPTAAPAPMPADGTATVTLATAKGNIVIAVKGSLGPLAAANFVALAECGAYDGTIFHRLVPTFVIQGGDVQYGREPNVDPAHVGQGGPGYQFADDPVTAPYRRGTVAMANSGANTNGSQFFICLADLATLPPNYSVFGTVTQGMDVVDAIAAMPNSGGDANQAVDPVAITKATVTRP